MTFDDLVRRFLPFLRREGFSRAERRHEGFNDLAVYASDGLRPRLLSGVDGLDVELASSREDWIACRSIREWAVGIEGDGTWDILDDLRFLERDLAEVRTLAPRFGDILKTVRARAAGGRGCSRRRPGRP